MKVLYIEINSSILVNLVRDRKRTIPPTTNPIQRCLSYVSGGSGKGVAVLELLQESKSNGGKLSGVSSFFGPWESTSDNTYPSQLGEAMKLGTLTWSSKTQFSMERDRARSMPTDF